MNPITIRQEDAEKLIVVKLRQGLAANYGYDLYIPAVIRMHLTEGKQMADWEVDRLLNELSPVFYAAAWDLCRRGIIRPGVRLYREQSTSDGSAGNGYSVTPFGRTWLQEAGHDVFVPTEPERFGELLSQFRDRLGVGYHQRGQEAVRCYGAHAYLACCAMCGAAIESILLALAIAKKNSEGEVLKLYASAGGRAKVENLIIGSAKANLQAQVRGLTAHIAYWRDEAAHGQRSRISDIEAYTALGAVLRFAQFSTDNWSMLTE